MQKAHIFFTAALVLLALSLSGCSLYRQRDKPEVSLSEIFPQDLPAIGQAQRLDVDGDGKKEWLVFYHVDLVEDNLEGSPTAAAVYRPVPDQDSRVPPHLVPALLWLPRQGYPCFYTCKAEMKDVIGQDSAGQELVIQDERDDDTVGAAIFRWQEDLTQGEDNGVGDGLTGGFVPLGHFRADLVTVEKDKVTVLRRLGDRSDLATREVYTPQEGHYYFDGAASGDDTRGWLRSPQEAEVVFAMGPPKEAAKVKLPEKLVMAFYQNFVDLDEVEQYVTAIARDKIVGGCPAETCGCASPWKDVSRAMVKQIAYETAEKPIVYVVVRVLCIQKNQQSDPMRTVTWLVRLRDDGTWRLINVFPGGDEYLISPLTLNR